MHLTYQFIKILIYRNGIGQHLLSRWDTGNTLWRVRATTSIHCDGFGNRYCGVCLYVWIRLFHLFMFFCMANIWTFPGTTKFRVPFFKITQMGREAPEWRMKSEEWRMGLRALGRCHTESTEITEKARGKGVKSEEWRMKNEEWRMMNGLRGASEWWMTNDEWAARSGRNFSQISQITLILCHTESTESTEKTKYVCNLWDLWE